ncbi:MAG: hypothetical protein AAGC46_14925, partial [Solirubrobacteraceae bacterium]
MRSRATLRLAAALTALAFVPAAAHAADATTPAPVDTLAGSFGGLLTDIHATGAPHLQAAEDDGTVGRISPGRVVWSSEPLEVNGAPVERALRVDGDVAAPTNPLVKTVLPLDPSQPMTIGSGSTAYTVTPLGASDGTEQVVGDAVLHAATHPATDSIARAVSGGAETYELIRDADAPQVFRYRVDGASPRAGADAGSVD